MSTATLPARVSSDADSGLTPEIMEKVVVGGDLSKLTSEQRLQWYKARCDAAGLDPRTQPFQYLNLQGKLTLYATKTATDQLIASRKLTVEIIDRRHLTDLGVFEVQCRVKFPDGHHVDDFAALSVANLKGEALCNALMKGVTKAKRRTVLSACGLGMLDESEVETIPNARSGEESPPAPAIQFPEHVEQGETWSKWIGPELRRVNSEWMREMVAEGIEPDQRQNYARLADESLMVDHVCTRLVALGQINEADIASRKPGVRDPKKARAVVEYLFDRRPKGIKATVARHLAEKRSNARAELAMLDDDQYDDQVEVATDAGTPASREPGSDDE